MAHELQGASDDAVASSPCADVATLLVDARLRVKLFTPSIRPLLNLLDTDVGKPISDVSAMSASTGLIVDVQKAIAGQSRLESEVWLDESRCYLRSIAPYGGASGTVEGVVITFIDVTAGRRRDALVAERTREAQASHNRTRAIVEVATDAVVVIDSRGTVELFNPAAEQMFGYAANEVVGRAVNMLMPSPHAEQHDGYIDAFKRTGVARIIGTGRQVDGKRKDGTPFTLDIAVAEIKEDGASKFVATMRDLTELQNTRAELKREHAVQDSIVATAHAIILHLDGQGRILRFNPYMEALCGYSLDEVRGKDWFTTFVPKHEQEHVRRVFASSMEGGTTRGNINGLIVKGDREVLVEWYDAVLEMEGEPPSLIAVGHDVTERDRLEREFIQAQKMEAVGRLAGGVAHDFNNLLSGIIGGLRIASKNLESGHSASGMLAQIEAEVQRSFTLTRRLLDFSRLEKPRPDIIAPCDTLSAMKPLIRRFVGEDVHTRVACDAGSSRILADAGQIEQAVLNLVINARDAMPLGGDLEIRCHDITLSHEEIEELGVTLRPGPHVVLSVRDTGCGMDAETRVHALDAFFTTKKSGLGTGLGLPSVVVTTQHFDGALHLESEVDKGTTVRLFFPKANVSDGGETTATPTAHEIPRGDGETILVVEDETLVRLGTQHILEELGYVVLTAKSPATALTLLDDPGELVDLLITDVVLPGMSGPELARTTRDRLPDLRVLFMSAFPTDELIAQGRIAPGTATLAKPFTDHEIGVMVRQALEEQPQVMP